MSFWDEVSESDPIADLKAWAEHIANTPPQLVPHVHLISPEALYRPGTYICHTCMAPVNVPFPLSEA